MKIMYGNALARVIRNHFPDLPDKIPLELLEPFRKNIEDRHGQTLERLNERGGLSPGEIHLGVNNIHLRDMPQFSEFRGIVTILDLLENHEKNSLHKPQRN